MHRGDEKRVSSCSTRVRVLRETGEVLAGTRGAAARLGLKRTTFIPGLRRLEFPAKSMKTNNAIKSRETRREIRLPYAECATKL
jgi:hypothetical protein